MSSYLFTSESVSEGHPDKVADQISDAVLDAILAQDKTSRVAAETLVKDNMVVLAGEITTGARVNFSEVVRKTVKRIGYNDPTIGFDTHTCTVIVAYGEQSKDIAQGVDEGKGLDLDQGAGDQGLMFGYACDETPQLMPLPIYLAHRLVERQSEIRRHGRLSWLRPDAKSQVTIKNVDAAGLATKCMVQVSYAIGVAKPTSVMVTTYGTGKISDEKLSALVMNQFDLRPKGIIQMLDLLRPIYEKTAAYGHFGREEPEFTWEATDKARALAADSGIKQPAMA